MDYLGWKKLGALKIIMKGNYEAKWKKLIIKEKGRTVMVHDHKRPTVEGSLDKN